MRHLLNHCVVTVIEIVGSNDSVLNIFNLISIITKLLKNDNLIISELTSELLRLSLPLTFRSKIDEIREARSPKDGTW